MQKGLARRLFQVHLCGVAGYLHLAELFPHWGTAQFLKAAKGWPKYSKAFSIYKSISIRFSICFRIFAYRSPSAVLYVGNIHTCVYNFQYHYLYQYLQ